MKIERLDNAFTYLEGPAKSLNLVKKMLTVEKDNWRYDYLVRIGRASKDVEFFREYKNGIVVPNGHLEIPYIAEVCGLPEVEFNQDEEIRKEIEDISTLIPFSPRGYQAKAAIESLTKKNSLSIMCTGSGKSLTISLILEYFRRKSLKGALIVPNINLLTQFSSDIKSYNLLDVHAGIQKAGDGVKAAELQPGKFLLITTWQSLMNLPRDTLEGLDFIICDEVHRFSSDCTSQLVIDSKGALYKMGFTGTLPSSKTQKMQVLGLFGLPNYLISSAELIEMKLGTPICIHGIKLQHTAENAKAIGVYSEYIDRIKYLIGIQERTALIAKLAKSLRSKSQGSTLILYTLIEHGESIYCEITGLKEVPDLPTQKELGIFFMTGKVKAKDREYMRNAMDENPEAILIANYSLLSTGVNIKALRYGIFAAPLKSYTAIVQSLGRGIRTSAEKDVFEVYDIADHFAGIGTFDSSYRARKKIYNNQKFAFDEKKIKM